MTLLARLRYNRLLREEAKVCELNALANDTLSRNLKIKAIFAEKRFLQNVDRHNVKTDYEWLKYRPTIKVSH